MIEVSAAIIKKGETFLIAQRGRNKAQGLMWEFPGGKLEADETPEESLVREIKEELNIEIEVGAKFGENIYDYPSGKIKLIAFSAQWISGDLKLVEHERVKWVKASELQSFEFAPADIHFVEKLGKHDKFF
ncbi:(deoxy)nucleoside triphosphate pyrophosphohydrolase [Desulfitobacterium metallireducens]|uniref:8-oxo-dGTP diphosphatase n=1 Tax=Desulfitobacterium metallireducens DSM 15288 TaxID=871968 RepID=W0E8B7_9FIRM|nr:(deoxy)nucleoside triphosphate pyrophosphohydrolase [Desulfitobacterium metallireducens]AHF07012.1 NUDIX hydrolase [Desulfitobacterium metallireducens DSM 15288]